MHLSEGVLHSTTLIAGWGGAIAGLAIGLKSLKSDRLSFTALFASAFFVASTIHIPVGIGSVHLILNGVAGLFLGWAVFPALFIALILQALLFSFGGFAVLGGNLCIMALPALAVHYLSRPLLRELTQKRLILAGILSGVVGVGGAATIASFTLSFDGGTQYHDLIGLLIVSHLPVFVVDSVISVGILLTLAKMMPEALKL